MAASLQCVPRWVRAARNQAHLWLGGKALPEAAGLSGPGPAQDTVLYPDLMLFAAPHDLGHVCDHGQKSLAGYIVHGVARVGHDLSTKPLL